MKITKDDILEFKQLSNKRDDKIINQYIDDAEVIDLPDLMCSDLLNDYENDNLTELLWSGGKYDYQGKIYSHAGIKSVFVHYAYARYVYFGSQMDAMNGLSSFNRENSQTISDKERQIMYTANRQKAFRLWETVLRYIERTNLYPNCYCTTSANNFKISKIV